jgi:biopolymer transport protein ExbB/TolQ
MLDIVVDYLHRSSPITLGVLGLLSFYLLLSVWTFVYRYLVLSSWYARERDSMEQMHIGAASVTDASILKSCLKRSLTINQNILQMCQYAATKEATKGLTLLSMIASTSPFIGLFGTVVSILEAFAGLGIQKNATLGVVAPAISEALVATAAGIFVAVLGFSFHLILKRKAFDLGTVIAIQADMLLATKGERQRDDVRMG